MSAEFANRELKRFSPEEYLLIEEQAKFRSEYFNGRIYAMAGASTNHVYINFNIAGEIRSQLKGKSCRGGTNDMRVKIGSPDVYVYPDTIIGCDPILIENNTLLNPVVIIEVLSPSTRGFDQSKKLEEYKSVESLSHIVLIDPDSPELIAYQRDASRAWVARMFSGLAAEVEFADLGFSLSLAEIYQDVIFRAKLVLVMEE